ncbi:DNase I-like protein [Mycena alexandri]|uniref:DNase I-like protein n=1 Tax=Mycena alexandri TaxID=1745969 RepID=A0AAD6S3U0_9AGAR|nr:DNase I-like protein [Mycena alexandri]
MKDQRIGIMVIGEAHLNADRCASLNRLYARQLEIKFSKDPTTSNGRGVVIVLNRSVVDTDGIKVTEIIPGRAMIIDMKWRNGKPLTVLGTHPNIRKPDAMAGDTNIVEDAIDRIPARTDPEGPVAALDELKSYLHLVDGWRETYPTTKDYTYHQVATGSQSRIDRIYIKRPLFDHTFEWEITTVGIPTDYRMVSVKILDAKAPEIGHGRWVWPAHILNDKTLTKYIQDRGMKMQSEMDIVERWEIRDPKCNVQTIWATFKCEIGHKARERSKILVPRIIREIAAVELKQEEEQMLLSAVLTEKLVRLQKQ